MLALSILERMELENTKPLTNVKTIEAKIPNIVIYWVCCLLRFSLSSL